MILSDKMAMRQIIGCLMLNPLLFLEYPDISSTDFDDKAMRACFVIIKKLYDEGAQKLTPIEVDLEIEKFGGAGEQYYKSGKASASLDWCKYVYKSMGSVGNDRW